MFWGKVILLLSFSPKTLNDKSHQKDTPISKHTIMFRYNWVVASVSFKLNPVNLRLTPPLNSKALDTNDQKMPLYIQKPGKTPRIRKSATNIHRLLVHSGWTSGEITIYTENHQKSVSYLNKRW